ncbi:hypothetical protein FKP32DRAFT_1611080 [Trametes sanguinea]|nr:hypothetical protein FKP32DRAFT_1611080 [Trametes sanguinea]
MSFISVDKDRLARDLWPGGIGRPSNDVDDMSTLPKWRVVPAEYSELCQWLSVDSSDVGNGVKTFINPDVGTEENSLHELTLRVQGFVVDANLSALGNWSGDVQGAPKAVQTLRLAGGGNDAAFAPQRNTLENIRELVLKQLCKPTGGGNTYGTDIVLKRRVFEKGTTPKSVLSRQDDPFGRAAKIDSMWRVTHRITAGVQGSGGVLHRSTPLVIRRGDFVDVAICVQVHSMRAHRQRKTEVVFCPIEVVRLYTAKEVKVSCTVCCKLRTI